jgi:hypothetical protein
LTHEKGNRNGGELGLLLTALAEKAKEIDALSLWKDCRGVREKTITLLDSLDQLRGVQEALHNKLRALEVMLTSGDLDYSPSSDEA